MLPGAVPDIQGSKQVRQWDSIYLDIRISVLYRTRLHRQPQCIHVHTSPQSEDGDIRLAGSRLSEAHRPSSKRCQLRTASLQSFVAIVSPSSATGPGAAHSFVLTRPVRSTALLMSPRLQRSARPSNPVYSYLHPPRRTCTSLVRQTRRFGCIELRYPARPDISPNLQCSSDAARPSPLAHS